MSATGTNSRDPYAAFRHANYRYYISGNFLSVAGQQMLRVAVGYEIYRRTHSFWALGFIGLAIWLPIFFLMLPGGMMADRYNRKKIALLSQGLFIFCSLGLALMPMLTGSIHWIYFFLCLSGVARAFGDPAKQSLLPQLVREEHFTNAVTWGSNVFQIASMIGPALGGILYAVWSYSGVCILVAGLETAFFLFILAIRESPGLYKRESVSLSSLFNGLKFVRSNQMILATITLDLFAVILGGAVALLPAYSSDILKCGPVGLGWLQAAPFIGAFLMSIILAHRPPMRKAGRTLLLAVAGFGAATIVFGLSRSFWLSLLMMFLTGALDCVSVVVRHTLVQILTPDAMRGRVTAVSYIFIHSSNELGGFESGAVAAFLGPVASVVLGGAGCVLVVLAAAKVWPELARFGSLEKTGNKADQKT